jgi:hypothetical protein
MSKFVFAAILFLVSGCAGVVATSETEAAICESLGDTLPTRSRADTQATIDQITRLYARFAAVCPEYEGLIP